MYVHINNSTIFGTYAACLWLRKDGIEVDYSYIDVLVNKADVNMQKDAYIENRYDSTIDITYVMDNNTLIKLHHKQPIPPVQNTVVNLYSDIGDRIETREDTIKRLKYDFNEYSRLIEFWKNYYPERSDIVHLSFELDNIRKCLKYLK